VFLEICIPSLDRLHKLKNCVNSIIKSRKSNNCILSLYFSNDKDLNDIKNIFNIPWINCYIINNYRVPDFWNSRLQEMTSDGLIYLNDDILLYEDTLDELFKTYQKHFPDFDGVMGINQSNLPKEKTIKSAFGVIGTKYADRFPDRQVWPIFYDRFFCDYELQLFAESINKFHYAENVKIQHLHGDFYTKDETHREVRKYKEKDLFTFNMRQNKKLLWGKTGDKI